VLILLALIFAAAVGIAVHFATPNRAERGVALAPLVATAVAAVLYTSLTWLGFAEDNVWLWVISLLVPILVTGVFVRMLSQARARHDARERARLRIT